MSNNKFYSPTDAPPLHVSLLSASGYHEIPSVSGCSLRFKLRRDSLSICPLMHFSHQFTNHYFTRSPKSAICNDAVNYFDADYKHQRTHNRDYAD